MSSQARRRQGAPKADLKKEKGERIRDEGSGSRLEPSRFGGFAKIIYLILLVGGIYYYCAHMLWEKPQPVDVPEEDAFLVPVQVKELPGRGMGVIATNDIQRGELVLREKPLFVVPNRVSMSPGAVLLSSLATLSPRQRESYYNLSYVNFPAGIPPGTDAYNEELALAIFQTNAVSAGSQGVGIFPRMARLNHGCSRAFNVVYTWRDDEGVLVVHALKPIKQGEELLTTYTDTKRPRHVRRQFLREHYGFECQCSVCSLPDDLSARSDERLTGMADLYTQFSSWQHEHVSGKEAIAAAIAIWRLGEEEGYWSERGQLAADVAHIAAAHSDVSAVREWAALAKQWYAYELGADSAQAQEMGRIVGQPQLHAAWGTRRRESVGGPEPWMSAA